MRVRIEPPLGHQLLGALGDRGQRVAGDEHRLREVVGGGVDVAAGELVLVGEGDGVDEEIEPAPLRLDLGEDRVHGRGVGHVAMADDMGADLGGERLDALLQRVALVGEGDLGARRVRPASAMPQAIERLLATPMMRPRLPFMSASVIGIG